MTENEILPPLTEVFHDLFYDEYDHINAGAHLR